MRLLEDPWRLYQKSLRDNAERVAIEAGSASITYAELEYSASALSQQLVPLAERGSSVGVLLGMLPEFVVADLAILQSAAVKVPLNPMLSGAEMAYILEHSKSSVLLTSDSLTPDYLAKIEEIRQALPDLVVMNVSLSDLLGVAQVDIEFAQRATGDDRAAIYYTGGTTGKPKGVVHDRRSVATNIVAHVVEAEVTAQDVLLLSTSLSHSAGAFAGASIMRGARMVLLERFTPEAFAEMGAKYGVTWAMVVPTMLYRLLDHAAAGGQLPDLKTLVYGSAPVTPSRLEEAIRTFGPVLIQLFGQTECPNWGTTLTKRDHALALEDPTILASCGKRSLFADVKVVDDDGTVLGPGENGEICLTAPYTMVEYLDNPDATAETKIGGWIHTRDIGQWDERGYLYVKDRKADMIITGGYNVYSSEVEAELQKLDGVGQVAVIGIPDPDWGEAVCAVIVPLSGADVSEERILSESRALLGSYKRPKSVQIVDEMPLTPFGKADKKRLRAPHWANQARAV